MILKENFDFFLMLLNIYLYKMTDPYTMPYLNYSKIIYIELMQELQINIDLWNILIAKHQLYQSWLKIQ